MPKHPLSNKDWIYEHRLIKSKELLESYKKGIRLEVHHIDKNKQNNSPKNLKVLDVRTHRRIELGYKKIKGIWYKRCPNCNKTLSLRTSFNLRRKDGSRAWICKKCQNKISMERNFHFGEVICPRCNKKRNIYISNYKPIITHCNSCAQIVRNKKK